MHYIKPPTDMTAKDTLAVCNQINKPHSDNITGYPHCCTVWVTRLMLNTVEV
jgi:hypothetical protein